MLHSRQVIPVTTLTRTIDGSPSNYQFLRPFHGHRIARNRQWCTGVRVPRVSYAVTVLAPIVSVRKLTWNKCLFLCFRLVMYLCSIHDIFNIMCVSIKSLYNFKNLLHRQLMRHLRQTCFMYSVVIKVSITLRFRYPVDEWDTVKRTPYEMATPREKGTVRIMVYWNQIGSADTAKLQNKVWKRSTVTFINSCVAQEIYGGRYSVR